MTIHTRLRLVDGPLVLPEHSARCCRVAEMAKVLIEHEAFADRHDAVLTLRLCGFSAFEVTELVEDAIAVAVQHVVAREMSAP
ncbi:hypothetical protein IC762_17495 [Bradyrhizobium genosp. L]|uniref:hypothetical protein n=1 Tax=Bradyrhizobium genosp. L TaxID=83637 RepID=UPI0018A26882|nr:hypothetical protein [Bradyrhizobium genosp. L]QPF81622.1 hypothetical protein IC762_17495 [Bradyrhizobium genosp. L]